MKLIIMSDNHGDAKIMKKIFHRHSEETEFFIHCGDSQLPYEDKYISDSLSVTGNCDYDQKYPKELIKKFSDQETMFITHGHYYKVKTTLSQLYYKALEIGATIVCFGHSHCVSVSEIDGIIFINPGSLIYPRNTKEKTYAKLILESNSIKIEILNAENGEKISHYEFHRG